MLAGILCSHYEGAPSPILDKNRAPMGPEISSSTEAGVWRKAPTAFPDSSSVLDKFQSVDFTSNPDVCGGDAMKHFSVKKGVFSEKGEACGAGKATNSRGPGHSVQSAI